MKIFNLFKKKVVVKSTSKVESLDKAMLSKVIGGGDGETVPDTTETIVVKSKSNIRHN